MLTSNILLRVYIYICFPHFRSFNSDSTVSADNRSASKSVTCAACCNAPWYSSTPSTACSPSFVVPGDGASDSASGGSDDGVSSDDGGVSDSDESDASDESGESASTDAQSD